MMSQQIQRSERVPKAGPLKAQLACYYILGELRYGETAVVDGLPSMLPDTRRGFFFYGNELYYAYCSETAVGEFGVAKVGLTGNPSVVTTINSDGTNHAGLQLHHCRQYLMGRDDTDRRQ